MNREEYKFIPSKDQDIIRKKNFDFFKSLEVFKNDYIISTIIRTYPKDLDITHKDTNIFYIFTKDTTLVKATKDDSENIEPLQVFDVKDFNTCGGGFFMHLYSKIDIESTMKQIDLELGESNE
jgi:hypothetical protein